ncbi:MAG: orotate phosphoribosyltransferase [Candidatus Nezhaarchaeales archaeon]
MSELDSLKLKVIEEIIRCGALIFDYVRLKSGRTSPYFFNVAKMFNPRSLDLIGEAYAKIIANFIGLKEFDCIFGPSYKGIPLAVAASFKMRQLYGEEKPILYDRKEVKDYGTKGDEVIVGSADVDSRLIIVDDVLTTGLTKLKVKERLENSGFRVIGVVVLMDRNELEENIPASEVVKMHGLKFHSVIDAVELFQVIWTRRMELGIDPSILKRVKEYYDVYGSKKLLPNV